MKADDRVFVAGHRGLVGSAIVRGLEARGFTRVLVRAREELDLRNASAVNAFFEREKPRYVFLAAAKVGGIAANDAYPGTFLRENLQIQIAVMEAARRSEVDKLLFLGSSCIYPKHATQPIPESELLAGPLEPTNEAYAVAKIAGLKMAQAYNREYGTDFISAMPTNLYGPGDNFDLETSHVLPALVSKIHTAHVHGAASAEVWGTGTPRREFLYVEDLADACIYLMEHYSSSEVVNVGVGEDITIRELAETISDVVGFRGRLVFNTARPDGTPRKLLDVSRMEELGWSASVSLNEGVRKTYEWFLAQDHRVHR